MTGSNVLEENLIAKPELVKAVTSSFENAMAMCDVRSRCVSISCIPTPSSKVITGMIGLHGKVTGFAAVSMSDAVAIKSCGGLLGESYDEVNGQVVDGAGELTNIIVGGIKSQLAGSEWAFSYMTVPSMIIGGGYQIAFGSGIQFVSATFEIEDQSTIVMEDRLASVSLSLLPV